MAEITCALVGAFFDILVRALLTINVVRWGINAAQTKSKKT